jgi:hypothetical protein
MNQVSRGHHCAGDGPTTIPYCRPEAGTVYRRLLGPAFEELPPVLRRLHDLDEADGEGVLAVTRGGGIVRQSLANLLRLPAAGERVEVLLAVRPWREGQMWTRHYDGVPIVTRQWAHRGLLVEAVGPYRAGFRLEVDSEGLRFTFVRAWLGPAPIPRFMALRIDAAAIACDAESWRIDVRISAPLLGLLARYEGEVTPEWRQP